MSARKSPDAKVPLNYNSEGKADAGVPLSVTTPISQNQSRRKLLWAAGFIFAVWVAMLLVMYFGTVYPHRHPATSPAPTVMLLPDAAGSR